MNKFWGAIFILLLLAACGGPAEQQTSVFLHYTSLRDIPGISEDEIKAVELLQQQQKSFVYGMPLGTETFRDESRGGAGEIKGFSALLCEWLSELFNIPFQPAFYEWADILAGLESGEIDFTGELTATLERQQRYFMTSPIAERTLQYFRLIDSKPLEEIAASRRLRYGFIERTNTLNTVSALLEDGAYEIVLIGSMDQVYDRLKSGGIDAFFYSSSAEAYFETYSDIVSKDFFPLVFSPVSLSTQNPALKPIIDVVQKILQDGGTRYLNELYHRGYQDYLRKKLFARFTEEERNFLYSRRTVPLLSEYENYPISFYNNHEKQWQGAAFDILDEITAITGLDFQVINDTNTELFDLMQMLERGEGAILANFIHTEDRDGRFLWARLPLLADNYTLLSRSDLRYINMQDISHMKVGLIKDTAAAEMFSYWFPAHTDTVVYRNTDAAFDALERGEVDIAMMRKTRLLMLTNYRERTGYKLNIEFDYPVVASFGFNKEQEVLCSIIDKAMALINVNEISGQWMHKTYDYRTKIAQAQLPWFIGAAILAMLVIILLAVLYIRNRSEAGRLENLVYRRTAELEELDRDLKIAVESAESASVSKSRFLANMSHEMRTPLNAIIGLSEMELGTENLAEESFINIEKIYNAGMNLLGIINDILDISKIESGKFTLIPVVYEISSLINDTINLNIVRIGSKSIQFNLHIDGSLPAKLEGDELRLKQIFNNLLSNAIKYTESGSVDWSISCTREGNRVKISSTVKDTGKGISEEDQQKLFSDYYQTDLKSNYYVEGTGLGLAITLNLIKLMGGTINLHSEYRKGSAFTVEFYQEAAGDEVIGEETAANLSQFHYTAQRRSRNQSLVRVDMSYASVLVVDDVVTNLDVARGMLKPYKLRVDCVMSGQEAIHHIRDEKTRYNAVFMDHMMPGMDGIEAVRVIRNEINTEYARTVPIIALTANALTGNDEMFMKNGFQAFLSKPIDILRLDQVLHQWVRDKEKEKQISPEANTVHETAAPHAADKNDVLKGLESLGINAASALNRFGGDMESYLRILHSFVIHAPAFIESARSQVGDINAYRIAAHSIKGSGRSIGAEKLGDMAEKLEFAAKDANVAFIEANNAPFIEAAHAFIDSLSAFLTNLPDENNAAKPEQESPNPQILAAIKEAAAHYDISALQEALKKLDAYRYKSSPDLVQWLQEKAGKSDFEAIKERLEN